jgi:hypothetical protein
MAIPTTRNEFKELILQNLGKGVLRIEVSDSQVENWIDFAIAKFRDYHFDGSSDEYYKHQITDTDVINKYIEVPTDTIGVVEIFDITSTLMGSGMWNVQYQYVLGNMPNWGMLDLTSYWMTMSHLEFIHQTLIGKQPIRYNRYLNKLYLDMSWDRVNVGDYLVVKLYRVVDPDTYPKVWADQWLQNYATQLVKRQWGNNTKKYGNMMLTDGRAFNGQTIYDEAEQDLKLLDAQLINTYSLPVSDMMG